VATGEARSYSFDFGRGGTLDLRAAIETVTDGTSDLVPVGDVASGHAGVAGAVTPETFVAQLLESMEDTSDLVASVRKISTSSGEVMNWPRRLSKVGGTFQHILEAANYPSVTDGDFGLFSLSAHKFGAIAEIPEEALTDPALNIAAIVAEEMGEDLAESLAALIYGGTQGTEITQNIKDSLVVTNSLGDFSAAFTDGSNTIYDALIDVQHSLRQKYRRNATWTVADDLERLLRKVKDGNGDYIWQPAVIAGQPDLLLGKPVASEVLMPNAADGALGVLYGDLNRFYVLRNVRNVTVKRSDEYGFDRDTVALKITWRGDGGVTDPQALAGGSFDPAA
jgi:HK97 family phage major capsid protein